MSLYNEFGKDLYKIEQNPVSKSEVDPDTISNGSIISAVTQSVGTLSNGKTDFTNSEAGYILGIDNGIAKFFIGDTTSYINWDGSSLTIVGGVNISQLNIPDSTTANSFHVDTSGNAWWGTNVATGYATAPAKILATGAATFSSVTITGGSVATSTLSGTIGLSNLNVANRGWVQTCVFSVTDADTIAWGVGTFTAADGTAYSIGASNTGNMSAKTYIYLDTAISTTAYQTTTTATTAVGAGKVLIAIAQNGTGEATYQVMGGQGGQNIDASSIVAGSITANEIAASTITSGKMNVSQLSGISADLGSITAGTIVLPSGGLVRSGQTDYRTGTGWFIGNVGGTPKLSMGVGNTGPEFYWDGTNLIATNINIIRTFTAGENLSQNDIVYPSAAGVVDRVRPTSFVSDTATFTEPAIDMVKILKIDDTRTLHVSGGASGDTLRMQAYIGIINAGETDIAYGSAYYFPSGTVNAYVFDVCQIDTTTFLVIFNRSTATTAVNAVILNVGSSGDTITAGTIVALATGSLGGAGNACEVINTTSALVAYRNVGGDSKNYVQVLSISGTTITTNTPVVYHDVSSAPFVSLVKIDTNKLLIVYAGDDADPLVAKTIDISGTTPTVNGSNTLDATNAKYFVGKMAKLSSTSVALVFDDDNSTDTNAAILTISGSTVTKGTDLVLQSSSTVTQGYINVVAISPTVLLVACRQDNSIIKYHLLYVDGTTITSTATQTITTTSNSYGHSWICKLKPFKYLGVAGHQYSLVGLGDNVNKRIGVAYENITDTNTGLVAMRYTTNTTFSGLTAGSVYYIDDNGQVSLKNSSLSQIFGIALNETSILVQ